MKSIKPGRGPSMFGFVGSIAACLIGTAWMFTAVAMGAPVFFPIFGLIFIGIGAYSAWYHYHNAASENRFSEYDITEDGEEPDPIDQMMKRKSGKNKAGNYCPYCGEPTEETHKFCPQCGAKL